jgi:oxaloacetate decarboxylase
MMTPTARRERFRAHLGGQACLHPVSVFDAMSARIADDIGYEIGMFAGSVASLAVLGAPDMVLLTLTEFAEQARRICRASSLSVLVDADHGYGNALNVMRTVEELETAGISALTIEDTLLPQAYGGGAKLIPIDEGVGKLRAALEARRDGSLVIAGRTSAVSHSGLDDALARIASYQTVGIDAMFLSGIKSRDQLDAVAKIATVPLILGSVPSEMNDRDYLAARGVRIALRGHQPVMAAIQATFDTMKQLHDDVPPKDLKGIASKEDVERWTHDGDLKRWGRSFLGKS